jgi:hypothetical protein
MHRQLACHCLLQPQKLTEHSVCISLPINVAAEASNDATIC